jgi:superkiller protein 3
VEFNAPKALYLSRSFSINYAGLEQFKGQPQAIALGYDPTLENAQFYRSLARLWDFRGEPNKERKALEKSAELDPTSSETWKRLGEVTLKLQQPLSAQAALMQTIQRDPGNIEAYRLLARLHWQQGQLQEAQRFYEQAASLQAPEGNFAEELGDFLRARRELVRAAEYYRSSVSQEGGSRPALLIAYAQVLKDLRLWETADQVLRFGMSAFPTVAAFPLLLGEALLEQERWLDAAPMFEQALAIAPKSAEAYYGLGRVTFGLGQPKEAVRYLERALQYNSYHREALKLFQQLQGQGAT